MSVSTVRRLYKEHDLERLKLDAAAVASGSAGKPILGHSTTIVTERYAHMRPDLFPEADHSALDVDLIASCAPVARIGKSAPRRPTISYAAATIAH